MDQKLIKNSEERMKKAVETIRHEVATIRTNKATTSLLDGIKVEYYGNPVPLQQVASVSVPEPRMLMIQPWERAVLPEIVKAIQRSDLGLNPTDDGSVVRLVLPTLTEERRKDLVKVLGKIIEDGRVRVRTIRRESNDELKKLEREHKISEDDSKKAQAEIQKLTDRYISALDELFGNCVFLLAAGHETTTSVMANGVRALLKHPDQLKLLMDDPSLMPNAVEELLRFESPVQWTSRRA